MRKTVLSLACTLVLIHAYSQSPNDHIRDINRKLKVLSTTSPDVPGGYIFNNSYEGLKGAPFLLEEFVPVQVKLKDTEGYFQLSANLDLKNSLLLYVEDNTNLVLAIPPIKIEEVIINNQNDTMIFRTSENKDFEPALKEVRFIQVLKVLPSEFIRVPYKIYIPADYLGGYTAKRRYDEYRTEYDYYLMNSGKTFEKMKLTKKSLIKAFPEKKEFINETFRTHAEQDKEKIVLLVLDNL